MEQSRVQTALTEGDCPATQCPRCASRVLFWWTNPKGHTVTWFLPLNAGPSRRASYPYRTGTLSRERRGGTRFNE